VSVVIERATSFGRVAELYNAFRPRLPPAAREPLSFLEGADVLELGAGTGIVTRFLLDLGAHVAALEPDEQMRAVLSRETPNAVTVAGVAEEIPFPGSTFDAVVASSAWHWFEQPRATEEIARVLRDGGRVVVLGNGINRFDEWVRRLVVERDKLAPREGVRHGPPDFSSAANFGQPELFEIEWQWPRTTDELVGLFQTYSGTIALDDEGRLAVESRVRLHVAELGNGDTVSVPMRTRGWVARRHNRSRTSGQEHPRGGS
jgi:SAM-dependent methyltransferase